MIWPWKKHNELVIRSNMTINLSLKDKKIENTDAGLVVLLHQGGTHVAKALWDLINLKVGFSLYMQNLTHLLPDFVQEPWQVSSINND